MKIHDFQAKWPMLQLVWKDSFPKWSHILHMCVYYTSQQVCQMKFLFSLHEKSIFHFPSDKSRGFLWRMYQIFDVNLNHFIFVKY